MAKVQLSNNSSGRIIVSLPYKSLLVAKIKAVEGGRWHPTEKHGSFQNTDSILEKILERSCKKAKIWKIKSPLDTLDIPQIGVYPNLFSNN